MIRKGRGIDMNWTARFIHGTEDLSDAYAVRIEVFCDEQGYRLEQELDELDRRRDTWHLVLYDGGYPAAAGRLYPKGDGVMGLGRLAVRKSYRGCGLGARMVEELGRKAAELGASVSQLDAQTRARGFYEKQGYRVCGEEHMDGHVPHVMMEKKLDGISNGFLGK